MRRLHGYIPSPPSARGLGHPLHLSAAPIPSEAAVSTPVVDQLDLGACTGNSTAVGICTEVSKASGLPPGRWAELPSRLFLYFNARALESTTDQDAGAMISDIFDAAAKLGYPPESAWSYPPRGSSEEEQLAKCVTQPEAMAYHRAADQKLVRGAYRLASTGQQLSDDVARAIAAGSVVVWGTDLDQAFMNLEGMNVWPGVKGPIVGGHAMLLRAYKADPHRAGRRIYGSLSSWDTSFADGGTAWVSQDAIESHHASEFWIVSAAVPNFSEVA